MARLHTIWGLIFVTVFVATGVYMRANFPELHQGDATMRMLIRSAHVYILLSAIPHLFLGMYWTSRSGWRVYLQNLGSCLMLATPVIFLAAFFFEPAPGRLDRPISMAGVISLLAGTFLHGLAYWFEEEAGPTRPD